MKNTLGTANDKSDVKKPLDQVALLQQKHDTLDGDLLKAFDKVQKNWKENGDAWRDKRGLTRIFLMRSGLQNSEGWRSFWESGMELLVVFTNPSSLSELLARFWCRRCIR